MASDASVKRRIGVAVACVLTVWAARPLAHLAVTAARDVTEPTAVAAGFVDDASRMNRTAVLEVRAVPAELRAAERQIAALLERARKNGWKVSIAGARHSMGGHTIYPGGVALEMRSLNGVELDPARGLLRVEAGATWKEVVAYLEPFGLSVSVMQASNSFTVGGSLSVNAHGWQVRKPPIVSTVESFRLMTAAGDVVTCSRSENAELFSLVLGGYGLFGVILDVELRVVPNVRYRSEQRVLEAEDLPAAFDEVLRARPDAAMAYARFNVAAEGFLDEALLMVYYEAPAEDGSVPPLEPRGFASLRRAVFRGSAGSDYGKRLRWLAETRLQPLLAGETTSRNRLLNEETDVFDNFSPETTDVLHEYFVPRAQANAFLRRMREIIPEHGADLLNVTMRSVEPDRVTLLAYATEPMFSFVLVFNQPRTEDADRRMRELTYALVDASLELGGRYYLPYRLHASRAQFEQAYPEHTAFFELKRKYDPDEIFQNRFYQKYGVKYGVPDRVVEKAL